MKKNASFHSAVILRSCALFIIMYQIRLIAADLSDTPVFTASLLAGFVSAVFLSSVCGKFGRSHGANRGLPLIYHLTAVVSIGLIPWMARAFIAVPGFFISDNAGSSAIIFDSLLLNLDRNNFVSLFPYYWSAVTTWFCLSSRGGRKVLRACVIADAAFLLFIYSAARTANIDIYRWPVIMIAVFAAVVFLQASALIFSAPQQTRLRKTEIIFSAALLAVIISAGGYLFLRPIQEQAVKMGGGFLEPKFFNFGFSRFPKLDSEISMKNDLLFIVKKEDDENILLRQVVISGYNRKQGFYPIEEFDEKNHPPRLPARQASFIPPDLAAKYSAFFNKGRYSFQEYFLINIDPSSFIGMKEPVSVIPYENWDSSSFKSAYAVESLVSSADYEDLFQTYGNVQPPETFGMSESEYKIYTEYGNDERIRLLAEEITGGLNNYAEKISAVYHYLKYGDYRYSLKPGIASNGDQLGLFLFKTKKGYCTYYAFAFTLLLRSLGIPARVAAGFFVDPETGVFDYYPVRADMAHAWTEVAFPQHGWIEFDPTSQEPAAGEEFRFSSGMDPALFEKLMREIFENRSKMKAKESAPENETPQDSAMLSFTRNVLSALKFYWPYILAAAVVILFLYIRCGIYLSVLLTRDSHPAGTAHPTGAAHPAGARRRSILLMKHACRRLRLAGFHRVFLPEPQWALQMNGRFNGIYQMYQQAAAARFAPEYSDAGTEEQWNNYRIFRASYKREVSLPRRIIAWILPPLAVMLKQRGMRPALFIAIFICMLNPQTEAQESDSGAQSENQQAAESVSADELFDKALDADYAELWDRAVELYNEGMSRFPLDIRFPWALGDLYYEKSLFTLAWDEYRKAEELDRTKPNLLARMARTAGRMNRDSVSVDYYERVLELDSDNASAAGSLGWMYFKVHRLADGEKLLLSAIEQFPDDADLSMTLGTIYSDMYDYEKSKYWYLNAISLSERTQDNDFTAVAYYNLSILESRFYHYDLCMEAINSSLDYYSRHSGRLAKGELLKRRLEIEKSQSEYEAAYETDTSPLSKINLAQIYQISGKLEAARLYAEDCLKNSDNSWMLYYGIDTDRYKRDIHEILANTYSGLAEIELLAPRAKLHEKIFSLLRLITYKLKYEVNIRLYRKYCLASANSYAAGEKSDLHQGAYVNYSNAFQAYPRRAAAYLKVSREFETSLIPAAVPSYNLEEGIISGNKNLVREALRGFDPLWERELISRCHSELSNSEELFALNRGALRQAGLKLPVNIVISVKAPGAGTDKDAARAKKYIMKGLLKAGFENAAGEDARYVLNISVNGDSVSCELIDSAGSANPASSLSYTFPLRKTTRDECYSLARNLSGAVFTVE
ncbi:MAG: hypothetical protein LBH16_12605 [Treponema sp.]|jgi:transglutaminase-like putative cysteine protease/uncharacterized membrane protein YqaE (UPF0057 family)|nr:hypothetical protein [Treponema sp.]